MEKGGFGEFWLISGVRCCRLFSKGGGKKKAEPNERPRQGQEEERGMVYFFLNLRRCQAAKLVIPVPKSTMVAGSGTGAVVLLPIRLSFPQPMVKWEMKVVPGARKSILSVNKCIM